MKNKFLFLFLCLAPLLSVSADLPCAPELKSHVEAIQKLPEAQKLIAMIQQEGAVRVEVNKIDLPDTFGAFWDLDNRIIYVNLSPRRTEGAVIGSILFELHNALATSKLEELDALAMQRKIGREAYTAAVERIEYENAQKASALSVEGIQKGIFPETAYLPVYTSFEEHYRIQQQVGHSAWISRTYDTLTH